MRPLEPGLLPQHREHSLSELLPWVLLPERRAGGPPGSPAVSPSGYWADDLDAPIRLARFPCCGRYVCRCGEDDEEVNA